MAPKRSKKSVINVENIDKYKNLVINDVLCPICRSIFIEPVTLPCNHGFCLACFNGTMENTTLTCPLCRTRIGSWLRSVRKENKVINDMLWKTLQLKFPKEIQKKIEGEDIETNEKVTVRIANPGEIRREYEIELAKEQLELQRQREAEEKASEIIIKKLLEEDKSVAKLEEENFRLDEEIAKRLTSDIPSAGPSNMVVSVKKIPKKTSIDKYIINMGKKSQEQVHTVNSCPKMQTNTSNQIINSVAQASDKTIQILSNKSHTSTILCQSKDKKLCSNAYKHVLLTKTLQCDRAESNGSDSGDSIKQEMRYFKPVRTYPKTPSKVNSDGTLNIVPLLKIPAIQAKRPERFVIRPPNNITVFSPVSEHELSVFERTQKGVIKRPDTPVLLSDTGKFIKQYYNKKRGTKLVENLIGNSPHTSPVLGFEKVVDHSDFLQMNAMIKTLSSKLNGENSSCFNNIINNNTTTGERTDSLNKNVSKLTVNSEEDFISQEDMDHEFALKLHEELNNPRHREYQTRAQTKHVSASMKTNRRKRQVTLHELVFAKKFKI